MGCSKDSVFDSSYFESLLPSELIDYLVKQLEERGIGAAKTVELSQGNKIKVTNLSTADKYHFSVAFFDAVAPEGALAMVPTSAEYGVVFNAGDIAISGGFTRKSYALKAVTFSGIGGITNFDKAALDALNLAENQEHTFTGAYNSAIIGEEATAVGSMVVEDVHGQLVTITLTLARQNRYYWGVTTDPDPNNVDVTTNQATGLGNTPSSLEADVGNEGYIWVATIDDTDIIDPTLGVSFVAERVTKSIQPVAGYNKNYKIQITTKLSGGTVKMLLK